MNINELIEQKDKKINRLEAKLHDDAAILARRMNNLMSQLRQGGMINSLGEVQSLGDEIDRTCALLHAAKEDRVELQYLAESATDNA